MPVLFSPEAAAVDLKVRASVGTTTAPANGDDSLRAGDAALRRIELVRSDGTRGPMPAPRPEKLSRFLAVYGDEGVQETVRAYSATSEDLPLSAYRTTAPRGRRMDDELRRLIHRFHAQGSPVSALSNTLNLSERRVKEVLASSP